LFVNNLKPEIDDAKLLQMFQPFGTVHSATVMIDFATHVSKGFGFVKLDSADAAQNAIKTLNGTKSGTRMLSVKHAESRGTSENPSGTPSANIYVKGFPTTMSEEELRDLFSPYGTIVQHKILKDFNGSNKSQAFVRYETLESAQMAINSLNGFTFPGTAKGVVVRFSDTESEKQQRKIKMANKIRRDQMNAYNSMVQLDPYGAMLNPPFGYYGAPYISHHPYHKGSGSHHQPHSGHQVHSGHHQGHHSSHSQPSSSDSNNLFIYHLPTSADDTLLYKLFSPYGAIISVKVVKDPANGLCKGFGFVKMADYATAMAAINGVNGTKIENKHLSVSFKK